jgi:hypothetical protein
MHWRKLGRVFCPAGESHWLHSHAAVPTAEHMEGNLFRIYFSSRDEKNRSYTGYVIIDINNPHHVLELSQEPVLVPGELGTFDDSGAMVTWYTKFNDRRYLYYIGWNLGVTVPFRNSIGVAVSDDRDSFVKYSPGPIVDRTSFEPHFTASCCVLPGNDLWRMWYLSCVGWFVRDGKMEHKYHIKYAESKNGIDWVRLGKIAIDFANESEYAISRPSVIFDSNVWRMWFSVRGGRYRIGYAESHDGVTWTRHDELVGIDTSDDGWDAEMIEYPFVFDHDGQRFMLYNGNEYGKTGFGIAVLEQGK